MIVIRVDGSAFAEQTPMLYGEKSMEKKTKQKIGRAMHLWTWILLVAVTATGCQALGKTPAIDDVAEGNPDAGLIEAWDGEVIYTMDGMPMEEETPPGPHTERMDRYDENGTLIGYDVIDYDAEDRVVREEQFDLNGQSESRYERSYTEDGRKEHVLIYNYDELSMQMETLYDENGNPTDMRHFDADGRLFYHYIYGENGVIAAGVGYEGEPGEERKTEESIYDENGAVIHSILYKPDGSVDFTMGREFDEFNRQTRSTRQNSDGTFQSDIRFIYDENGIQYRTEYYGANGEMQEYTEEEFDAEGRAIKHADYQPDGTLKRYTKTAYTTFGKVARTEEYDGSETLTEYTTYEYDDNARIKRMETYDGSDALTEYRRYVHNDDGTYMEYICMPTGEVIETRRCDAYGNILS